MGWGRREKEWSNKAYTKKDYVHTVTGIGKGRIENRKCLEMDSNYISKKKRNQPGER
jgi:hypothetical protein